MHTLVGGGGLHGGFNALDCRRIKHGDSEKIGPYPILAFLQDKFARFLYEFMLFDLKAWTFHPYQQTKQL